MAEPLQPLTSLRFFAAMMIVALHAKGYFAWPWLHSDWASDFRFGHGVSFFFVLSGFILTHVYGARPLPFRTFIWLRFWRLWPLHAFSIVFMVVLLGAADISADGPGLLSMWWTLAANLTLTQSLVPLAHYFLSWNSAAWSISTEFFFYLAFPLLAIAIGRTWPWKLALSLVPLVLVAAAAHHFHLPIEGGKDQISFASIIYANPLIRGFEFVLGMSAYVLWAHRPAWFDRPTVATALEAAALALAVGWLWRGIWNVLLDLPAHGTSAEVLMEIGSGWAFALMILALAAGRGLIGRTLSWKPLVWLGEISFSVYMLHQILLVFYTRQPSWMQNEVVFLAGLILTAALAHYAIERPARNWARLVRRVGARDGDRAVVRAGTGARDGEEYRLRGAGRPERPTPALAAVPRPTLGKA